MAIPANIPAATGQLSSWISLTAGSAAGYQI